jgi:hypothetical protein
LRGAIVFKEQLERGGSLEEGPTTSTPSTVAKSSNNLPA